MRTWAWMMEAPASTAAWALSTCSATVIGTAGLFSLRGRLPVMATQMMQGVVIGLPQRARMLPPSTPQTADVTKEARSEARKTMTLATSSG